MIFKARLDISPFSLQPLQIHWRRFLTWIFPYYRGPLVLQNGKLLILCLSLQTHTDKTLCRKGSSAIVT